jgi:hypothetical protein
LTFFRSPESDFVLQFRLFPFNYDNVSEAEMDQAAFGDGEIIHLPKGYKGDIVIGVIFGATTETIRVPAGQTLRDVLVQKGINPYRVAKVSDPKPITDPGTGNVTANDYDVRHFTHMAADQDQPKKP